MRRTIVRLVGTIVAAAILPALIWVVGTSIEPSPAPIARPDQAARPTRSGPDICLDAPIASSMGASGQGTLCLTDSAVRVTLQVTNSAKTLATNR